jgi:hypothetical protein
MTGPDSATVTENGGSTINISYKIVFVGGVGVISGTATESDAPSIADVAAGVVGTLPDQGNCITPVAALRVSGVVRIVEPNVG